MLIKEILSFCLSLCVSASIHDSIEKSNVRMRLKICVMVACKVSENILKIKNSDILFINWEIN